MEEVVVLVANFNSTISKCVATVTFYWDGGSEMSGTYHINNWNSNERNCWKIEHNKFSFKHIHHTTWVTKEEDPVINDVHRKLIVANINDIIEKALFNG